MFLETQAYKMVHNIGMCWDIKSLKIRYKPLGWKGNKWHQFIRTQNDQITLHEYKYVTNIMKSDFIFPVALLNIRQTILSLLCWWWHITDSSDSWLEVNVKVAKKYKLKLEISSFDSSFRFCPMKYSHKENLYTTKPPLNSTS